jgi:hypothetical protein
MTVNGTSIRKQRTVICLFRTVLFLVWFILIGRYYEYDSFFTRRAGYTSLAATMQAQYTMKKNKGTGMVLGAISGEINKPMGPASMTWLRDKKVGILVVHLPRVGTNGLAPRRFHTQLMEGTSL